MTTPPLSCTVRQCGQPLERRDDVFVCPRGHSYDIARRGYVNLLQPQDRKSAHAGDSGAAVTARARLLATGVGASILERVGEMTLAAAPVDAPVIVDLGSGSGELLGSIEWRRAIVAVGIDLSTAAAEYAARAFPDVIWVVANADRRLPLLDDSVDVVVSLNGRRNPAECARILRARGALIVGVPAANDLIELREAICGEAIARVRADGVVAEHASLFTVTARTTVSERHHLKGEALRALAEGTYRAGRTAPAARIAALEELDVTVATDLLTLAKS